jgi:hypothetical protein
MFAQMGRQVHAFPNDFYLVLSFQWQDAHMAFQSDAMRQRFQAADAEAIQYHFRPAFHQEGLSGQFHGKVIAQWLIGLDHLVRVLDGQFGRRDLAFENEFAGLDVA